MGEENPKSRAAREARYRRLYDITVEDYDTMLAFQGGGCAICGRPPGKTRLAVDHNHLNGEVRGVLCFTCNRKLGERILESWLEGALKYLRAYPSTQALGRTPAGVVGRVTTRRRRRRKGKNATV